MLEGSQPPEAGFTSGNGTGFYELPYSGTDDVALLQDTSNIAEPGVWVFLVSGNDIYSGGEIVL